MPVIGGHVDRGNARINGTVPTGGYDLVPGYSSTGMYFRIFDAYRRHTSICFAYTHHAIRVFAYLKRKITIYRLYIS